MAKPFFKWVGGKTQLLGDLTQLIPATEGTYYEPFIGGAATFFHFQALKRFRRAVLNDVNPEIINCYTMVRDQLPWLIERLDLVQAQPWNTSEYFYNMRASKPSQPIDRAVRFLYLLRTCFNGIYRVNRKGEFNTPFGKYANPRLYNAADLKAASEALQGVELRLGGFRAAVYDAQPGDVVYFDPPYVPVSKTANFTAYAGEFGPEQQQDLANLFQELVQRGVTCVESNSDAPLVRELYRNFPLTVVGARRNLNSDGAKRGPINEIVVVGSAFVSKPRDIPTVFDFDMS
jgi:DNA adenine methylase